MDYTTARFILDDLTATVELQPRLREGVVEGIWENDPRFTWSIEVRRATLPSPDYPRRPGADAGAPGTFRYKGLNGTLAAVRVNLYWTRGGQDFTESYETLLPGTKLARPGEDIE